MLPLLAVLGMLFIIVVVHELGHFLVMRLFGVRVKIFAFGWGPKIFGVKLGETEYCFLLFPIGGMVVPDGPGSLEEVGADDPAKDGFMIVKPAWQRMLIAFAGPAFNFLLTIVLLSAVFYRAGGVANATTVIGKVAPNSPAEKAGLKMGDRLAEINGKKINSWDDVIFSISGVSDKPLNIKIKRGSKVLELNIVPQLINGRYIIGVEPNYQFEEVKTVTKAVGAGTKETLNFAKAQIKGLAGLATGKISGREVSGPVGIFKESAEYADKGFWPFVAVTAILSVLIGVANLLFPIPILDGGLVFFCLLEMIRRKRLSRETQETINNVGWAMIMALMFLVIFNDFSKMMK